VNFPKPLKAAGEFTILLWILALFLELVDRPPCFAQNPLKRAIAPVCRFLKGKGANPGNLSTI
jgi:hypothetical protein